MTFEQNVVANGDNIHALAREIEKTFEMKLINNECHYALGDFFLEFKSYGILIKKYISDNIVNVGAIFENGHIYWNKEQRHLKDEFHDLMYDVCSK